MLATLNTMKTIAFEYAIKPATEIFTNPENKIAKAVNATKFVDKFFKGTETGLAIGKEIAIARGASEREIKSIGHAYEAVKGIRSGIGLLNSLNGAIAGAYKSAKTAYALFFGLFSDAPVELSSQKKTTIKSPGWVEVKSKKSKKDPSEITYTYSVDLFTPDAKRAERIKLKTKEPVKDPRSTLVCMERKKHNDVAVGFAEKGCALISNIGFFGGAATYAGNFLIVRPPSTIEKMSGASFGEWVRKLSSSSQHIWTANHACVVTGGIFGLIFQWLAFDRALDPSRNTCRRSLNTYEIGLVHKDFMDKSIELALTLGEKIPELAIDILQYAKFGPPALRLTLAGISVIFGTIGVARKVMY